MGSSTSSLASFNGTSKFASSLQQTLTRAVGIASLPVYSLSATQTKLSDRQSGLQSLDARFAALQSSLSTIQNTVKSGVLSSSVSNGAVVSATVEAGATAGVYSIEVENLGSFSSALSVAGASPVTDPTAHGLNTATKFQVTIGSVTTPIDAKSSSLQDVASAINLQAGTQVQASIVNVGSSGSPDYRLSLRATKLGADPIVFHDNSSNDLISTSSPGALASFKVDASGSVTSDSRTLTLSPGVTVNLLSQSAVGVPTTVTVRDDATGLASAFSSFASSFNNAVDALAQSHGASGGVLQGDSLVNTLNGILRQLANYGNGTPETALANYGITLNKTGHLTVDSAALATAAKANFASFLALVGDTNSGGFLKTASDLLDTAENANTGLLKDSERTVASQLASLQDKISDQQARISQLQQNLIQQLAKADTAIAKLEGQVSYVNGLFYSIIGNNHGTNSSQ